MTGIFMDFRLYKLFNFSIILRFWDFGKIIKNDLLLLHNKSHRNQIGFASLKNFVLEKQD